MKKLSLNRNQIKYLVSSNLWRDLYAAPCPAGAGTDADVAINVSVDSGVLPY